MRIVLDASVLIKWLFNDPDHEPLTVEATALVEAAIDRGAALQPVHWLAEVSAVLARKMPEQCERDLQLLDGLDLEVAAGIGVMQRACRLSIELGLHVFDTLYHAVALETEGAVLITADRRYLNKARRMGGIFGLEQWFEAVEARP